MDIEWLNIDRDNIVEEDFEPNPFETDEEAIFEKNQNFGRLSNHLESIYDQVGLQ